MRRVLSAALGLALLAGAGLGVWQWSAARERDREVVFSVPPGAVSQLSRGEQAGFLPETVTLTLGVRDTLVIRNEDSVPVEVGGLTIAPGQRFVQRYRSAGTFDLACTLHASERIRVIVQRN